MIERRQFLRGVFATVALSVPVAALYSARKQDDAVPAADDTLPEIAEDALEPTTAPLTSQHMKDFTDIGPQGSLGKSARLPTFAQNGKGDRVVPSLLENKPFSTDQKPVVAEQKSVEPKIAVPEPKPVVTAEKEQEPAFVPPIPTRRPKFDPPAKPKQEKTRIAQDDAPVVKKKKPVVTAYAPTPEDKSSGFKLEMPSLFRRAPSRIQFFNVHTGEKMTLDFRDVDTRAVDYFMRDFRRNETKHVDSKLISQFGLVVQTLRNGGADANRAELISGYRSPETNAMLQKSRGGQASNSEHLRARAMDMRFGNVSLSAVHRASTQVAKSQGRGGVGYYPSSDFVHIDVARLRFW